MQTELLTRIDAFCASHRMSASTFGRKAVNDGKLVERLRSGKTITLSTMQKVEDFMTAAPAEAAA